MSDGAREHRTPGSPGEPQREAGRVKNPWRPAADAQLDELRALLTAEERSRLDALEASELDADEVAELLPDAILRRERKDDRIARALESTIEGGLFKSARRDPQALADAIHPALGPAIRSMIQASLRQSLEKFNVALENALSPQGVRWRLEAARTGQSFSEVVLLNTLLYRVEQVLLVHRETGLLISEVSDAEAPERDADLLAGMLSAIRDFGADSIGTDLGEGPKEIEFEGLALLVAQAPAATVALVVRGNPPRELHERARETAEALHINYAEELQAFDGDATALAGATPILEDLVESEEKPREKSKLLRLVPALIGAVLVALLMYGGWIKRRASDDIEKVRVALESAPGVLVTDVSVEDGDVRVQGLADPLATSVQELAAAALVGRGREVTVDMRPFASLDPPLILARLRRTESISKEIPLRLEGTRLIVVGLDPNDPQALRLVDRATLLPGIDTVEIRP